MSITIHLDRMLVERKISSNELADKVGISPVNLSRIKTGKVKGIRFSTLEALCKELECEPGDLLGYEPEESN